MALRREGRGRGPALLCKGQVWFQKDRRGSGPESVTGRTGTLVETPDPRSIGRSHPPPRAPFRPGVYSYTRTDPDGQITMCTQDPRCQFLPMTSTTDDPTHFYRLLLGRVPRTIPHRRHTLWKRSGSWSHPVSVWGECGEGTDTVWTDPDVRNPSTLVFDPPTLFVTPRTFSPVIHGLRDYDWKVTGREGGGRG